MLSDVHVYKQSHGYHRKILWCSGIFRENAVIFRVIPPYSVIFRHIPWYSAIFRDIPAFRVFTTPVQKPFVTDCMQLAEYCIINIKYLLHVQPWLKSLNLSSTWTSVYPLFGWSAHNKVISVKRDIGINSYTYKWLKM
jgi:hypothetical protein